VKGISRRARTCAALAATGAAVLASAGVAQAGVNDTFGEGTPTGQGSVQLFNYGGFISNGANVTGGSPGGTKTLADLGMSIANAADGSSCATATSSECRWNRLDSLFAFLAKKGVSNVELFDHANLPSYTTGNLDVAGWQRYRAMLDKYNLHAGGWHGSMTESQWDTRLQAARILGMDYIGSGGFPSPGIGSYDNTLRTVEALNRLGKRSVEAGVGPVYFHNHQGEFRSRYVDNGVLKTAWQIVMERMDPRYVVAEIDAGWASDAYDDNTGTVVAGLINQFPNSVKLLHIKDVRNNIPATPPASGNPLDGNQGASPVAFGSSIGEIDYRPIFAAAKNRVQYFHQEQDGGSLNDADISLTNLKGTGSNVVGTAHADIPVFPSVPAGTAAANNVIPVKVQNTGDAPLNITAVSVLSGNNARAEESPADFAILSNTCVGTPLPGSVAPTAALPGGSRSSCVVNVGFKPTTAGKTSVARLSITSNADNATEQVYLVGKSTSDAINSVGGDVASTLSLTLGQGASFGSFTPALARTYTTATTANIVSTAGNAALSVTDPSTTAPGHLVNAAFALAQPLQVRATNGANPTGAFQTLSDTAGTPVTLLSYVNPTAGADPVTLSFSQAIGATDVLRAGSYAKTLTFTVSTTTP